VVSTPAYKAQNTAILAVLRGFATQQDGVLDGATVQGLAVGAINGMEWNGGTDGKDIYEF
jgi:hypothetical protein